MDSTPDVWYLCVGASRGQMAVIAAMRSHGGRCATTAPLVVLFVTLHVKAAKDLVFHGGRRRSRHCLIGSCCADVIMHDTPANEAAGVAMDVDNVGIAATVPEACERCRNGHQCDYLNRGNPGTEGMTPNLEGAAARCRRSLHSPYGEHGICGQSPWRRKWQMTH